MAQFDVHRLGDGMLVVDCQSDLLSDLQSRFVVPLIPRSVPISGGARLNPLLRIGSTEYLLTPQGAASLSKRELGSPVAFVANYDLTIVGAIDVLTGGV